jgi:hypothetical protein
VWAFSPRLFSKNGIHAKGCAGALLAEIEFNILLRIWLALNSSNLRANQLRLSTACLGGMTIHGKFNLKYPLGHYARLSFSPPVTIR